MQHLHTLNAHDGSIYLDCDGCETAFRFATYDEAVFIQQTDGFAVDGPMVWRAGCIVVPVGYSIFYQEV